MTAWRRWAFAILLCSKGVGEMSRSMLAVAMLALCVFVQGAVARTQFKIVTASPRGTYIEIGRDIARLAAEPADIALEGLPSAGSAENVRRLRFEEGVKLALVQSE